jgi:Aspartyl protease/Secretin and TonB N terminus short domain
MRSSNCKTAVPLPIKNGSSLTRLVVLAAAICMSIVGLSKADAVHASVKKFLDIPAGNLGGALNTLAKQRGFQIVYITEDLEGSRTRGAKGEFTPEEALNQLLIGTGFTFRYVDDKTVTVVPGPPSVEDLSPSSQTISRASTLSAASPQFQEGDKGSPGGFAVAQVDPAPASSSSVEQTYVPGAPPLPEFSVDALEPRYVAPTRRDRIGRIWAPVMINDKGPFRLVLDTAASRSGVNESVARALGIPLDQSPQLMLRGVTGSAAVPSVRVASLSVGDLTLRPVTLPIVTDALGGAEGVLGTEGLGDMRIYIDFQRDFIGITHSRRQRAGADFKVVPMLPSSLGLIVVDLRVGTIRAKGIISTASQVTVGNSAMLNAVRRSQRSAGRTEQIEGITTDVQTGQGFDVPTILLGTLGIQGARAILGDMHIFETWKMTKEPVLLIGMDTIGQLDTVVIDYRLRELQLRMRTGDRRPAFPNP